MKYDPILIIMVRPTTWLGWLMATPSERARYVAVDPQPTTALAL